MKLQDVRWCGAILAMVMLLAISNMGAVDGAEAMYVLGDSYVDTGNREWKLAPYGSTWPGYPANRWSDGRVQSDYFAELFELPLPTPVLHLGNESDAVAGVNFARSGAGVTYAYGVTPLKDQVDEMQALVTKGALTQEHLRKSVTIINIGVNDYDARNLEGKFQKTELAEELTTFASSVVDGIAVTIVRLYGMGMRHIVVANLPLMECLPLSILELAFKACSPNSTLHKQTALHNALLQERVKVLNEYLRGLHVVIVDQSKAFQELFTHAAKYGFVDPLVPCCHGDDANLYNLVCGANDTNGKPMYTKCKNPSKSVLFDTIHPTDFAWKTILHLWTNVAGFTLEGPKLQTWIRKYNV